MPPPGHRRGRNACGVFQQAVGCRIQGIGFRVWGFWFCVRFRGRSKHMRRCGCVSYTCKYVLCVYTVHMVFTFLYWWVLDGLSYQGCGTLAGAVFQSFGVSRAQGLSIQGVRTWACVLLLWFIAIVNQYSCFVLIIMLLSLSLCILFCMFALTVTTTFGLVLS